MKNSSQELSEGRRWRWRGEGTARTAGWERGRGSPVGQAQNPPLKATQERKVLQKAVEDAAAGSEARAGDAVAVPSPPHSSHKPRSPLAPLPIIRSQFSAGNSRYLFFLLTLFPELILSLPRRTRVRL